MRTTRLVPLAAAALALSACGGTDSTPNPNPDKGRLTVLFTTDEHAHLFAAGPEVDDFEAGYAGTTETLRGGIARRATLLAAERAAARARGAEAITVSAGDFTQGTLSAAAGLLSSPDLVALKRLGYDAVAIGNHEFDAGPAGLAGLIGVAAAQDALPPLVLTNVIFSASSAADDALAALHGPGRAIAPSRVITLPSGNKVGVVASMGVGAGTDAAFAVPVTFWDPALTGSTAAAKLADVAARVQAAVNGLRTTGQVDAVVLLAHGGVGVIAGAGDDEKLAALLSGVDLVVSGHSHHAGVARTVRDADGLDVPVVQPSPFGAQVGRAELVLRADARPRWVPEQAAFLDVTFATTATTDAGVLGVLATAMGALENPIFAPAFGTTVDFVRTALTHIEGSVPPHAGSGDLYYRTIGHAAFDVPGLGGGETKGLNLDVDAMLDYVNGLGTTPAAEFALQNYGSIRGDLLVGRSGKLSFADVYRLSPNGVDPLDGTPGFPLVRVSFTTVELRAALEGVLLKSLEDGDYFLGASGLRVEYDLTRPLWDGDPMHEGWVKRVALADGSGAEATLLYDVTQAGTLGTHFLGDPTALRTAVTTVYVAGFASAFGVQLRDPASPATVLSFPFAAAYVRRGDGSAVKDVEALGAHVYAQCAPNGTGSLPARYGAAVPNRMVSCVDDPSACH